MLNRQHAPVSVPKLDRIFRAQSVAIVGASPKPGPRNRIVKVLMKHGFEGRIYPVTPSNDEVEGLQAYKSLAALPEVPDVALIITPADTVPGLIEECGEKGIQCAIVFSAGFEEVEGGQALADQLRAAADKYDVDVLGPNGQGVWSVKAKTMLNFGGAAYNLDKIEHAPIAIISQSGALSGAIGNYLQKNGLGCSYIVAVGNETCLDALDVLSWIIEQDDVRVVTLYIEGLDNAQRLISLADRARRRGVQIVALKVGRSTFGQEATASHTGKIASPYRIYQDVLEQAGIILVKSLAEAMAAIEVLCYLPDPRRTQAADAGVSILSSSGGAGALLADHGEELELPMAKFSPQTGAQLEALLPVFARKANPVDLTGQVRGNPTLFNDSLKAISADPGTEAIVVQFSSSGEQDLSENAENFKTAARDFGVPLVASFAAERLDSARKPGFLNAGVLVTEDPSYAMRALRWLYDRRRFASIEIPDQAAIETLPAPTTWDETMDFMQGCAIPAAQWKLLHHGESARDVCADMSWPVVVKALPSDAEHKTELGLVQLNVDTPEAVDAHAAHFRQTVGNPEMAVLIQEMVTDGIEVVLSSLRNTDFGPVLSIGSGGVAIELYRDVTYLAPPVTADQVRTALKKLKLWTQLQGFRGRPPADIDALVEATVRFGNMILKTPALTEAEFNPLLVRPRGQGVVAVDFLGKVDSGAEG